jgi:uncharacterized protein YdeI (YjbR/CyaY-like superfamily)
LDWLEANHDTHGPFWMKFAKKNSGEKSLTYEEAREGALCYGWIDGLTNSLDEKYYLIRFTPRGPKSTWSQINCALVEEYIKDGRMKPSGLVHIEAAKADGRWDKAYTTKKLAK